MSDGLFVVLEGGDGSGKSTQARLLAARLREAGTEVVETHEPGATDLGERLRSLLLDGPTMDPMAELLLLAADRAQHVAEIVRPALVRGAVVICDRYVPSSLAYQGIGRGLGITFVDQVNQAATAGLGPDMVIVLDIDEATSMARRDLANDRIEAAGTDFHRRVRAAYRDLASDRGWTVVDGTRSPAEVADSVARVVADRMPPTS